MKEDQLQANNAAYRLIPCRGSPTIGVSRSWPCRGSWACIPAATASTGCPCRSRRCRCRAPSGCSCTRCMSQGQLLLRPCRRCFDLKINLCLNFCKRIRNAKKWTKTRGDVIVYAKSKSTRSGFGNGNGFLYLLCVQGWQSTQEEPWRAPKNCTSP